MVSIDSLVRYRSSSSCTHRAADARTDKRCLVLGHTPATGQEDRQHRQRQALLLPHLTPPISHFSLLKDEER